jgi:hypothetical protein
MEQNNRSNNMLTDEQILETELRNYMHQDLRNKMISWKKQQPYEKANQ